MSRAVATCVLVAACALLLTGCLGPQPTVMDYELREPQQPGDPYVMLVTVHNRSRGEGEISVGVSLRVQGSNLVVATGQDDVQLRGHETAQVAIELRPGAPGPYDADVGAVYPP
jgi:hypothetical protein